MKNKDLTSNTLAPFYLEEGVEAGCDEAGRGCLAGPVVAAAVILDPSVEIIGLNDSKKLSASKRGQLRGLIEENALDYQVAVISPQKIDEINILQASILGMHEALNGLRLQFDRILVDGNKFKPYKQVPYHCMVKGDARFLSIAAASILAKEYRDEIMKALHLEYPSYGWDKNMGYPTKLHREAIKLEGPCVHHRKSFRLLPEQLSLDL